MCDTRTMRFSDSDMRDLMGLTAFIAKGHKSQKLQILPSKTMMKQAKIAQSSIVRTKVVCYLCVTITFQKVFLPFSFKCIIRQYTQYNRTTVKWLKDKSFMAYIFMFSNECLFQVVKLRVCFCSLLHYYREFLYTIGMWLQASKCESLIQETPTNDVCH